MDLDRNMVLHSDFSDYYDRCCSKDGRIVYNRFYSNSETRATALSRLKNMGIKTIELQPVHRFDEFLGYSKLVVYTNQKKHQSQGKEIMTLNNAQELCGNCAAAPFYDETDGVTMKVLQVGSRRFRILLKNDDINTLQEGKVTDIQEIRSEIDYTVGLPVFSIDYINTREGSLAIDFNYVQRLENLGIETIIPADKCYTEIRNALINLIAKRGR